MRIIFLNTWHGRVWEKLHDFLLNESKHTDIFCLSEVDIKLHAKLRKLLSGYESFYDRGIKTIYLGGVTEGRNIFVRNGLKIINSGHKSLYHITPNDAGGFQFVELKIKGKKLYLGSIHGKARPGHKKDTNARINQSKRIIEFFKDKKGARIIGGDFNLSPDTKSVALFEEAGYKNLIKEFGIKGTRNRLSWEFFSKTDPKNFVKQYFADYVFTSPDVKIKKFKVPNIEVSDHLPLILNFEI